MNYKIILAIIFALFPIQVYAEESMDINCKRIESVYECGISGNIDYSVSAIDFHFSIPEYAQIIKYDIDSNWEGSADDNWVSLYSAEDHSGNFQLLKLTIEANKKIENADIKINDLLVYDSKYVEHKVDLNNKKFEKNNKFDNIKLLIITICAIIILGIIALIIKMKGDSK